MQQIQRMSHSNKQNLRQAGINAGKKSIRLKHGEKRLSTGPISNETGFFNNATSDIDIQRQGEQKLIQLTSQCAQYFERFTAEKDMHLQIIDRAFADVTEKVEIAFGKIILQAQRKLNEIRTFLSREHQKLQQQKCMQEEQLNRLLQQIKSVHLTRLDSSASIDLTQTLAEYAATLDKFFNVMTQIENNSYEDSVEECMSFINNLVRQELKVLQNKFPPKLQEIIGQFNSGDELFTFEEDGMIKPNEESVSLLEQMDRPNKENVNPLNALCEIQNIKNSQNVREGRINQYRNIINSNNPFKTIKLAGDQKGVES